MTRTIALIPARSGSKGLPHKNIRPMAGKPMLAWSVEAALACSEIDAVFLSTDSDDYARIGREAGAEILMRPAVMASDTAVTKDVIRHHMNEMDPRPDVLVLLQPTSPLRTSDDIRACLAPVLTGEADSAATAVPAPFSPYKAFLKDESGAPYLAVPGFDPWIPRHSLPPAWAINGAVYAVRVEALLESEGGTFLPGRARLIDMPVERSIDIDTLAHFEAAERALAAR